MIQGRCPTCGKTFQIGTLEDLPSFPFCTDRCKLVDLGRWLDGDFRIPEGGAAEPENETDAPSDEE
jgi:endogenous inhibitor of DNA gyrase (YacG/DUF329 family)